MIQVRAISRSMWVGIRNNSMLTWLDKDLASLPPHSCLNWKDICFVFLILKSRSLKGKLGTDCSVRNKHCKMRNVLISRACCFSSHSSHSFLEAGLQVPTKAVACYAGDSLSGGLGLRVSHFQTQTLPFYSQLKSFFIFTHKYSLQTDHPYPHSDSQAHENSYIHVYPFSSVTHHDCVTTGFRAILLNSMGSEVYYTAKDWVPVLTNLYIVNKEFRCKGAALMTLFFSPTTALRL